MQLMLAYFLPTCWSVDSEASVPLLKHLCPLLHVLLLLLSKVCFSDFSATFLPLPLSLFVLAFEVSLACPLSGHSCTGLQ